MDLKINFINILPTDSWLDGAAWGILGKEIRVVLSSCAVISIRNFYPPPGPEEEWAFEGFRYADE